MNPHSLRFRLTAWQASLLCAVFIALGTLLYVQVRGTLEHSLLETQARRARQIADTLLAEPASADDRRLAAEIESLYAPERGERFIRLLRPDGSVRYVSGAPIGGGFDPARVPLSRPPFDPEVRRREVLPGGSALLVASVRDRSGGVVEVGTDAAPVEILLHRLLLLLALGVPVVVAAAAAVGYRLVGGALRPVEEMTAKAEAITHRSLSERLPVGRTGDELERLALSLNRMIGRLDEAFQQSRRFVADASHELRTPLTVQRGELEELAENRTLDSAIRERIGSLLEESERLSKIVERLFTLSRLDAGEAQTEWICLDLARLADDTAEQMALLALDRRIEVARSCRDAVLVRGDRARLKQVVVNLLDNAFKYTPVGGRVEVRAATIEGMACLDVSDTGVGIPAEALPHVFERFYRADHSRSRDPDGAGLGLAIVQSIVQAHGGRVEADSPPGQGSRFRVRLPLA